MTLTNAEALANASTTFHSAFSKAFESPGQDTWAQFASMVTGHDQEHFELDVLSAYPTMKRWLTERTVQFLRAQKKVYDLDKFEATLEIDLAKLKYNSIVSQRINAFFSRNKNWKDEFFQEIYNSTTILCYNGQPLLSDSHPYYNGGTGYDNLTTDALSPASVRAGILAMEGLEDERNKNMGVFPTKLMTGPTNRELGMQITGSTRLVGIEAGGDLDGGTNVAAGILPNYTGGMLDLVINQEFAGTQWCLIDDRDSEVQPMIYVENEAPTDVTVDEETSESVFMRDKWLGGIRARCFFIPGEPSRIYGRQSTS